MPVPVILDGDADFIANGADDGRDLRFERTSGEVLAHDIEAIDRPSGNLIAWVVLPDLDSGGAEFSMFYGDANAVVSGENPWTGLADLVYHFESEDSPLPDHSLSGFDGTHQLGATGTIATAIGGKIGAGLIVDRAMVVLPNADALDRDQASFSMSLWFDNRSDVTNADRAWFKGGFDVAGYQIALGTEKWRGHIRDEGAQEQVDIADSTGKYGVSILGLVHIAMVVDRSNNKFRVYQNGQFEKEKSIPGGFGSLSNPAVTARIGDPAFPIDGVFDELRAYPSALTDDWIEVDHALSGGFVRVTAGPPADAP